MALCLCDCDITPVLHKHLPPIVPRMFADGEIYKPAYWRENWRMARRSEMDAWKEWMTDAGPINSCS